MEKYIFDQCNGLWYELQGDYYIPCLMLNEPDTANSGLLRPVLRSKTAAMRS